jgi:hypothetical protein
MTDLQMSLIAIGGTIVVGVISYNKWQEHKAKKSVEQAFSSEHADVLMQTAVAPAADGAASARHEPGFSDVSAQNASKLNSDDGAATGEQEKELSVDALIDCNISLVFDGVVQGEKILPVLQSLQHIGYKSVHFIGRRQEETWEEIKPGCVYSALQAGVQLASRSNALNELEYSELVMRLREVADTLGAELDVPDMPDVIQAARELHRFIVDHDAQLGINVHTNGAPWAVGSLLAILDKQGFEMHPDGRFMMPDGDGGSLFSLSTNASPAAENTPRLTLLLSVPCVAPMRDGFGAMVACAKSLAGKLDGTVVDDGNNALSDEAIAGIAGQVYAFYDDMQAAEIPAGSTRAQRLFY